MNQAKSSRVQGKERLIVEDGFIVEDGLWRVDSSWSFKNGRSFQKVKEKGREMNTRVRSHDKHRSGDN